MAGSPKWLQEKRGLARILIGSLLMVGCSSSNPYGTSYLSASLKARFLDLEGTSKVLGEVYLPQEVLEGSPITHVAVDLVDRGMRPVPGVPSTSLTPAGHFVLSQTPADQPRFVRVRFRRAEKQATLLKFISPSEAVTCVGVTVASTLIAGKLISQRPLMTPLTGVTPDELMHFVDPVKLDAVERLLGEKLAEGTPAMPSREERLLTSDPSADLFERMLAIHEDLAEAYNRAVEPSSTLVIGVANKGTNQAPIPGLHREDKVVFGVLNLQLALPPMPLERVEYLINGKVIATASDPKTNWQSSFDTWAYPDGPYELSARGYHAGSNRELSANFIHVKNTTSRHCPSETMNERLVPLGGV